MLYPESESSIVEWKREIPQNDQLIKTAIGFCNQFGGKLVIGVDDKGFLTVGNFIDIFNTLLFMKLIQWARK